MGKLILILGDQLNHHISSLKKIDKKKDTILMCEVMGEATYVKHHKKKIAFIFSAMRHFRDELIGKGYAVLYTQIDDKNNSGSFDGEVKKAIAKQSFSQLMVTHPVISIA